MGKPQYTDVKICVDNDDSGANVMEVYDYWDESFPIPNVKTILVEFTPKAATFDGDWRGVLFFENGEECEVSVTEIEKGTTFA